MSTRIGTYYQALAYADNLRLTVSPVCDREVMAARFIAWWWGSQSTGWNGFYDFCQENTDPPIPMRLHCPSCNTLHIDKFETKSHHTHACQTCGMVWRPAIKPTVGVQFLPGFKDV